MQGKGTTSTMIEPELAGVTGHCSLGPNPLRLIALAEGRAVHTVLCGKSSGCLTWPRTTEYGTSLQWPHIIRERMLCLGSLVCCSRRIGRRGSMLWLMTIRDEADELESMMVSFVDMITHEKRVVNSSSTGSSKLSQDSV